MSSLRASAGKRRLPTIEDLRRQSKRRIPRIAFDYVDGAVGAGEQCHVRNHLALDAVELVPRYGNVGRGASTSTQLFGRGYAIPLGIAPMGMPSLVWPGGELMLARAAQEAKIPFVLGMVAGLS